MERRASERHRVWLPVRVDALAGGVAVTHDASQHGLLVVAASTLDIGAEVTVAVQPPDGGEQLTVVGRVVRVEENEADPNGLWPHRIAIAFDSARPELEPLIGELERTAEYLPSTRPPRSQ